jgi:hypothetical protein
MSLRRSASALLSRAVRAATDGATGKTSNTGGPAPFAAVARRMFASDADLLKTPLYDFHVENGGTLLFAFIQIN